MNTENQDDDNSVKESGSGVAETPAAGVEAVVAPVEAPPAQPDAPAAPTDIPEQPHPEVPQPLLFNATGRLEKDITDALNGVAGATGVPKEELTKLCRVIDYWLDDETGGLVNELGLLSLAQDTKRDYVFASFLAWKGEYKVAYITLRTFLEGFCLLLYYLNQGCDRLLYLKGKGYKLMLHRMAQKRPDPDDMHAFRRNYHLLISDGFGSSKAADKFFEEIDSCYGTLSKAVHGSHFAEDPIAASKSFLEISSRVLRICNTLAIHEPMLSATPDDLEQALQGALHPALFDWKR